MKKSIIAIVMTVSLSANAMVTMGATPIKNNLTNKANRAVINISSASDIKDIKNKIPEVDIKMLKGGQAVVYSNKISETQLLNKLSKLKNVKKVKKPDTISVVKPTDKVEIKTNSRYSYNRSSIINYRSYEYDLIRTEAYKAWSMVKQQKQIKVAVVDTGVDYNHPALKGKIDLANAYNFVSNNKNVMDDQGHGTHVSGIITTNTKDNYGLMGITGQLNVQILPVKVLDSNGSGDSDIIAQGITYAVDKGADIINMSFGGEGTSPEINNAIQYAVQKGVIVVAAAGNDNTDCSTFTPASLDNVLTVSALSMSDRKSSYSNYGNAVELSAPGDMILSTYPNGRYAFMSGTSMATPVVTGIAAIVKAQNPTLTAAQIEKILEKSSVDLGVKGKDKYYGYGKVDAYKALNSMVTLGTSSTKKTSSVTKSVIKK
ncbi:S8 family peptidase [Inconstantimicrobium mannanitabidum]|uniref:Uncharacterized protein n=1 Tax=Inconstantimicrobium mannanitabidum TaxID=1604901 RepID=A0ACB5R927_9CLOT|nr:S8 family peptidase [Clostridium sp. TW13]GKX65703.1 hypothetical protein rsdtw13_09610 [Clostridium sp. TW13]